MLFQFFKHYYILSSVHNRDQTNYVKYYKNFEQKPGDDAEINKILEKIAEDNEHWGVVKQLPGMRIQHDGRAVHFVITITEKPDTVCLSVGTTYLTTKHVKRFVHYIH